MKVEYECPFCRKQSSLEVDDDAYDRWQNGENVIKAFPKLNAFEREFLITRVCYECQEKIFHCPKPGNEAEWGKRLGECPICGCNLYEKEVKLDGNNQCKCPSCTGSLSYYNNTFMEVE